MPPPTKDQVRVAVAALRNAAEDYAREDAAGAHAIEGAYY